MPRVTKQDWRESKRKLRRSERAALFAVIALFVMSAVIPALFLVTAPKALALGSTGPDPADFQGRPMTFVVDNTIYVGAIQTSVMLYYKGKNGNNATINSAGMVSVPTHDTYYAGGGGNPQVTVYQLFDVQTGALMGTCNALVATSTCSFNFNFPAATSVDLKTGYFGAQLRATVTPPAGWQIQNGFWVTVNAGSLVGFDSNSPATSTGVQDDIVANRYTNWLLKFGADCSVLPPGGKSVPFIWYDPDNGDPIVQPQKSSFRIIDVTGSATVVNLYSPGGSDFGGASPAVLDGATDTVTPGDNSKTNGHVYFTALPYHIYEVQWNHVFSNNTLQFQLPFDSIFFLTRGCAIRPYTITPSLTTTIGGVTPHLEPGTVYPIGTFTAIATANTGPTKPFTMTVTPSGSAASALNVYNPSPIAWAMPAFPSAGVQSRGFGVTISNTVADGTTICFSNVINPGREDAAGALFPTGPATLCLPVFRTRFPAIVGFSGDIHAGGGLCVPRTNTLSGLGSSGYVKGNSTLGSYGQYVVSASAPNGIINFGSAGTPPGTSLNLGLAGAYARACRPDLLAAANTYRAGGVGVNTIGVTGPPTTFNVTGKSGIWYFDGGGDLNILGTVGSSVTIIKTSASGVVRVSGPIVRSAAAFAPHSVPSLGVVSAGDIVIPAAVINVDAYLFANGTIDTCEEGAAGPTRTCATPLLTINGFLMGRNISFHRLGPFGTKGVVTSEQVTLSPQIYLNPPKFFDFTVDGNFTDGQGEKQPLF